MAPNSVSAEADTVSIAAAAEIAAPERNARTQLRVMKPPLQSLAARTSRMQPLNARRFPPQNTKAGFFFFSPGSAVTEASNTWRTAMAPARPRIDAGMRRFALADHADEAAVIGQLVEQRLRHLFGPALEQDHVEGLLGRQRRPPAAPRPPSRWRGPRDWPWPSAARPVSHSSATTVAAIWLTTAAP